MIFGMPIIDLIILVITIVIVSYLFYYLFLRKDRSHCSSCAVIARTKRSNEDLRKYYYRVKNENDK